MNRALIITFATLATMYIMFMAVSADRAVDAYQPPTYPVACHEDEWCWNNLTMGNHRGTYQIPEGGYYR